ncbi:mismatch-specific DNA-glycosylase [Streptomyces sp. NPDC093675]|uniref:mismatch-specific DNA-glycosylase n=1 Tax=Streptomyces sp. NPDC093675 TaxID=3366049 RepID=UPI0038176144
MTGFSRAELDGFRGGTLPDLLGPRTRLLFVGVNPGLSAVALQAHFPRRSNRFYPALYRAGITDRLVDASSGFAPGDREYLAERGIGITALVPRATARADELSPAELLAGAEALAGTVVHVKPRVVAVLGITAYRIAFAMPRASVGRQPGTFAGAQLWVVPNPSGLNAHSSLTDLAAAYRETAIAAGLRLAPSGPEGASGRAGRAQPEWP